MKLVFKNIIQAFLISMFILINVFFVSNKSLAQEKNQELIIQLKTGQIMLLKFDSSNDLGQIKKEYAQYDEIEIIGENNEYTISALPNDPDLKL